MMTAALGTLPFLATLWLLIVLGARVFEESGSKIAAALKGETRRQPSGMTPARLRTRIRFEPASAASAEWRAAA
jgi:hypothetical protein